MTSKLISLASSVLLLASLITAPAFAVNNDTSGTGETTTTLEGAGYTCTTITSTWIECTKSGSKTYWCSSKTDCGQAPRTAPPRPRPNLQQVPVAPMVLSH